MIRYVLPLPPSGNNLFLNVNGRGRIKTPAYRDWIEAAGYEILAQGRQKLRGKVSVALLCSRPDRRKRDCSNLIKPVEDLLVRMAVIEDDSFVERVSSQWTDTGEGVTVIVQKFEQELAAA